MTKEEAIKTLKGEAWICCAEKWNEALDMAIKSLEQEPCEDVISRKELDKALYDHFHDEDSQTNMTDVSLGAIRNFVRNFPPVTLKQKIGHWIPMGLVDANGNRNYECSECHHGDTHAKTQIVPYCWYCGAKMEGVQE